MPHCRPSKWRSLSCSCAHRLRPLVHFPRSCFGWPWNFYFRSFPWHIANSQVSFLWLIQSADLVGPYGAGFVVMWFNAALITSFLRAKQEPVTYVCAGLCVFALAFRSSTDTRESKASKRNWLTRANYRWPRCRATSISTLSGIPFWRKKISTNTAGSPNEFMRCRLVIWPESAIELIVPETLQALPKEVMPSLKSGQA